LKSSGKSQVVASGAAESAAVDADLAQVITCWSKLTPHAKATIVGILRAARRTK
jgi:hypothetical protein